MGTKRITAIVPEEMTDSFERSLRKCGVPGMTIDKVRGFGQHANFFSSDLLKSNIRVVVYVSEERAAAVIHAIRTCAQKEYTPSGILTVEAVERLIDLSSGEEIDTDRL